MFSDKDQQTTAFGPNLAHYFFINKVLLEHNHTHSFTYCLWLFSLTIRAELSTDLPQLTMGHFPITPS